MRIPGPLLPARFLSRPNRFLTIVDLDNQQVAAHLPDPGRLRELLVPGAPVWVRPASSPARKTSFTLAMTEAASGELVSLVTTLPNQLVEEALEGQRISELADWQLISREHAWKGSRFDFLLGRGADRLLLEVKSVTLVEGRRALFPDAVTRRGTRHVTELAAAGKEGVGAAVLFVVQRRDAESVTAARAIDPAFADALAAANLAGVRLLAYRCRVTLEEAHLAEAIPVSVA
ncbi:MAG TPA: DNA/RNA nuclease SfsA [Gemmatimonadota bacterium]|nr:DNA/RNA nuclease SfsA [Gemmatimonadota bacterium]